MGLNHMPGPEEAYFLGLDGGGTKTHTVITDSSCRVIGEAISGASNPLRVGLEQAVSHVEQAVTEALARARVKPGQILSACAAIAGINHPIHHDTMRDALDRALQLPNLELVSDARAALEGALDGRPGVIVIAGTGSIAMGINEAGEIVRSGGWGPIMSDEGSGYDIARRALQAVVSSFDGRSPQTLLAESICKRLGVRSASDLPGVIYNSDSEPVEIASLAELVEESARAGDPVAGTILADAGRDLALMAASVIRQLGFESRRFRVAVIGSVFKSGELVLNSFRSSVLGVAPQAEIGDPLFPPTIGAVKLAQKRCQMPEVRCY
jgi:N-acetylglucosamine kinase-like BadF-type ATPase